MNEKCKTFWLLFLKSAELPLDTQPLEVFYFSDSKESADELAHATIEGRKTGTAALFWEMESTGIPKKGDLSLVTFSNNEPACVIETTEVNIVPFNEVTQDFASTEGESDLSLDHWRKCHWREFVVQCKRLNHIPSETMPVICERFKVIYKKEI